MDRIPSVAPRILALAQRSLRRRLRARRRADALSILQCAVLQVDQVVTHLGRGAAEEALSPLSQELAAVRGASQAQLRPAMVRLRAHVLQIRDMAARGEQPPALVAARLREVGSRLMEADWLARRAAARAAGVALDLRRLCAVGAEIDAEVQRLLGIAEEARDLASTRAA